MTSVQLAFIATLLFLEWSIVIAPKGRIVLRAQGPLHMHVHEVSTELARIFVAKMNARLAMRACFAAAQACWNLRETVVLGFTVQKAREVATAKLYTQAIIRVQWEAIAHRVHICLQAVRRERSIRT